jgi:regulatory protein
MAMPTITNIEPQKRNKNRYNIYLDKEFAFGVSEDVVVNKRLSVGQEVDDVYIKTVIEAEEKQKCFNDAVNLLSFRLRSEQELKTRLRKKGYEDNWIEDALEKLRYYKYVDDEQFARMFTNDRMNLKKLGQRAIKQELRMKGINKEIIDEVVEEICEEETELSQAIELAEKKARTLSSKDDFYKQRQKLLQHLVRKGYSFEIAGQAIKRVFEKE